MKTAKVLTEGSGETIAIKKIIKCLTKKGWGVTEDYDPECGQILLAYKVIEDFGPMLRTLKPFRLTDPDKTDEVFRLQKNLKEFRIEVVPYEVYGNKTVKLYNQLWSW